MRRIKYDASAGAINLRYHHRVVVRCYREAYLISVNMLAAAGSGIIKKRMAVSTAYHQRRGVAMAAMNSGVSLQQAALIIGGSAYWFVITALRRRLIICRKYR